eukprot:gene2409-18058_t
MDNSNSSVSTSNSPQLSANQLPTFVTQQNSVQSNKQSQSSSIPINPQVENIQQVSSSAGSIMVIQPGIPSAVGLVPASGASSQVVSAGQAQASSEHPHIGGLYTTATGLPPEYVIPGTNMISSGTQGFHVHVPVMSQQEGGSEDGSGYREMDEDSRGDKDELREQDRFLPIANVARIMKKGIPKQGKIAKDAKECVQELNLRASERCQQEKRKTINGEDILFAMSTLGFDNYVDPLKQYLAKYRDSIKNEKGAMNSSSENIRVETDQDMDENAENNPQSIQFQVAGTAIHPSMVAGDQQSSTIYTYPAPVM